MTIFGKFMNQIICPNCDTAFKVDEAGYADILKQVRDEEFEQAIQDRLALAAEEKASAIALAEQQAAAALAKAESLKDVEIQRLKSQVDQGETTKQLAVNEALKAIEKERDALSAQLAQAKRDSESAEKLAAVQLEQVRQTSESEKRQALQALQAELAEKESQQKLAVAEAVSDAVKERDQFKYSLEQANLQQQLAEQNLRDKYETQIKDRDEAIERLRDLKAKLSTKMVGETLEQHCEVSFNQIRATAFPNAYFEKDNDAQSGSKGDFIFRDSGTDGTEFVSIMFEMKNESDTTATKKKNEDFFKELDKDRNEKGCEYAILVSLLEPENELYNAGIVDVSYRYPKMYVIRPQFFIPMVTLLRNAALGSLEYKQELALVKSQNIDVTNFEADLEKFKTAFAKNYDLASRKFSTAIAEIDKSIDHLQKTKEALLSTDRNLRLANDKAQDVTVKKLTRKNPTMAHAFKAVAAKSDD